MAEQAANADEPWTRPPPPVEAITRSRSYAKMLRLEVLKVKADLERKLETWSLNCSTCGLDVHWGLGARRLTRTLGAR